MKRQVLEFGSTGEAVRELQALLGIDIDGDFGEQTDAAVREFQEDRGLKIDGVVGDKTWAALEAGEDQPEPEATEGEVEISPELVAKMFPRATLRANIEKYLPHIMDALIETGLDDTDMVVMALATIRAESAGFVPISEFKSKWNTDPGGRPYGRYDFRTDLGNGAVGDGARYRGRGFIQLTGKFNYRNYGKKLGIDLVANPEMANDPSIAAKLLALFLNNGEARIRKAIENDDLAAARRYVNGGSHGLAEFTEAFRIGQRVFG